MRPGYNSNGLAHHLPKDAISLVSEAGFEVLGLTIDHHWLSPQSSNCRADLMQMAEWLRDGGLSTVIETGARFLLDPRRKHWPPLTSDKNTAAPRVSYIRYAIDVAAELHSHCVSIWSGIAIENNNSQKSLDNLARNLHPILEHADRMKVDIGFEPEPGMFIDTLRSFERLLQWIEHPRLRLTMDIGHLYCQGELPIADQIGKWKDLLVNVHIEDMRAGVHDHLMFGEGEIHFPPVIEALKGAGYNGPLCVELSRHSNDAVNAVRKSRDFLQQAGV